MKHFNYFTLAFILIQILFVSCGDTDKLSEINVAMTYDEVEGILGKPSSISRGANELYYDINEIQYELLQRVNLDTTEITLDSKRWFVPHQIRTVGKLIYVAWEYEDTILDTFYVIYNTFRVQKDTLNKSIPVYFLGTRKVSKSEYLKSDGYDYRLHDNSRVDKSMYESYKKSGLYKLPVPQQIEKRIKYYKDVSITLSDVKDSIEKKYYVVTYKYCVIFDSSSGRVTKSGYFPFYARELHSEIIKEKGYK